MMGMRAVRGMLSAGAQGVGGDPPPGGGYGIMAEGDFSERQCARCKAWKEYGCVFTGVDDGVDAVRSQGGTGPAGAPARRTPFPATWEFHENFLCQLCFPAICVAGFGGVERHWEFFTKSILSEAWMEGIPTSKLSMYRNVVSEAEAEKMHRIFAWRRAMHKASGGSKGKGDEGWSGRSGAGSHSYTWTT